MLTGLGFSRSGCNSTNGLRTGEREKKGREDDETMQKKRTTTTERTSENRTREKNKDDAEESIQLAKAAG